MMTFKQANIYRCMVCSECQLEESDGWERWVRMEDSKSGGWKTVYLCEACRALHNLAGDTNDG
jgi:hypothetical protein